MNELVEIKNTEFESTPDLEEDNEKSDEQESSSQSARSSLSSDPEFEEAKARLE